MNDIGVTFDQRGGVGGIAIAATSLLVAGWICYPAVLLVAARVSARKEAPPGSESPPPPPVTVIIATRDAPEVIAARVSNLAQSAYPSGRLQVLVAVDAAAPFTLDSYRQQLPPVAPECRVIAGDPPGGKAAALNAAMREVATELVAFADAAQTWLPDALGRLVDRLAVPGVVAATGAFEPEFEGGPFRAFWRYETGLRRLESRLGMVVGVTGAIYAIHRSAWMALPSGLICDDLLVPLRMARAGGRVQVVPGAIARDPRRLTRDSQLQRKVRTLTGVLQICAWEPWVLLPHRNRMWAPFVCHKLLRIATPLLVLVAGMAAGLALGPRFLVGAALGGGALAILAGFGLGLPPRRLASEMYWGGRLLAAPLSALRNALLGRWGIWHHHVS